MVYECSQKARVFIPGRPFQPSLMFTSYTRLETPARDKNSSFLPTFVNYGRNNCYKIGPRMRPQGPGSRVRPGTCFLKLSEVAINSAS